MSSEDATKPNTLSSEGMRELFGSQAKALYVGIQSFAPQLKALHQEFDNELFADWPTVLLSTIQQTTTVSLFKLLPPPDSSDEPIDCRSIASLIRNMVDTHDALDFLCNSANEEQFNLHRDILGHYISGQTHSIRKKMAPDEAGSTYDTIRATYWTKINKTILDKQQKIRLRRGETLFYSTRRERLDKACGEHSDFVSGVLAELSTYVHSIPPSLWMRSIDEGFLDTPTNRGLLGIWLQIANFYFANSIRVVGKSYAFEQDEKLDRYLERFRKPFPDV